MTARTAAGALAATLLLAGCSADLRGEIRGEVADITRDANARDAGAVRRGVDDLLALLDDAVRSGELTSAEAAEVAAAANAVRDEAALLDEVEQTPTPTPEATTQSPSPEPTTASPTPRPTTPSPEPTEDEPVETEEPEPTEEPDDGGLVPTVVPGAALPGAAEPAGAAPA